MDKEFACYWLLSRAGRHQIEADAHGTSNSMVKISQSQIKAWVFAVPPHKEQKAIVSYLDKRLQQLDELVLRVTRAIARLKDYRSALITTAITGQIDVCNYRPEAPCQ
jgi:type I restriction enzyme S subunit